VNSNSVPSLSLVGRRIVVTGASSGIGRATAVALSQLGASVIAVGRNPERLNQTMITMQPGGHSSYLLDLAENIDALPGVVSEWARNHGPFNGLVHCAGIEMTLPVRQMDAVSLDKIMRVNTGAALMLVKGMCQKGNYDRPCSVVMISSVAALTGQAAHSAYSASKGALSAMSRSLAMELARKHIRVNTVCPGQVATEMDETVRAKLGSEKYESIIAAHPLGLGRPIDVAGAIAFLLSDASAWITGTDLIVDGGFTAQ